MKRLAFLLALVPFACGDAPGPDPRRAEVAGVVLDRASGQPIPGALVLLPGGREVRTDASGRFLARDLDPGLQGEIVARADDGREGRNSLRRLAARRLEVVVYAGP